jgi:hypothetical protein
VDPAEEKIRFAPRLTRKRQVPAEACQHQSELPVLGRLWTFVRGSGRGGFARLLVRWRSWQE